MAHEIFFGFKRIYLTARQRYTELLDRHGVTPARLDVLRLLLEQDLWQRDLQQLLGIASSTLSRMLVAMERKGLIVRRSSAAQRRPKRVAIAPSVRKAVAGLVRALQPVLASALVWLVTGARWTNRRWSSVSWQMEDFVYVQRSKIGDRAKRAWYPLLERYH